MVSILTCKSCGKKFQVSSKNDEIHLGSGTLDLGNGSTTANKYSFGDGGKIVFGDGGIMKFSKPVTKYTCPNCNNIHEYSNNDFD